MEFSLAGISELSLKVPDISVGSDSLSVEIQISDIYLCTYEAIFFANAILCSNIMCCVCVEECVYYIYTMHNQRKTRGNVIPRKTPLTDNKCCTGLNFMEKACRHNQCIPSKDEFTVDDH